MEIDKPRKIIIPYHKEYKSSEIIINMINLGVISPENYEELFRSESPPPFLANELFMWQYSKLGCLVIQEEEIWQTYLYLERLQQLLNEGVSFFESKEEFDNFEKEFLEYMEAGKALVEKHKKLSGKVTRDEFNEICKRVKEIWIFQHKTEFFYSNNAYEISQKNEENEILKNNLTRIEKLKNEGRTLMNEYIVGKESLLMRLIRHLSAQFSINHNLGFYLSQEDVNSLFEGRNISEKKLQERKEIFAMAGIDGELVILDYADSKKLSQKFTRYVTVSDTLKGTVACSGKLAGRAFVVPSKFDITEEGILRTLKLMNKGDILVAHTTSPEITILCEKAGGIITDQGGLGSHAAIISREFGIPCIVGTKHATQVLKTGDHVEIDAIEGIVRILKRK